jgi:hypothetical protein
MRQKDSTKIATGEQGHQVYLPPHLSTSSDGKGLWGDHLWQKNGNNEPRLYSCTVTTGWTILDRSVIIKELFKGMDMSDQYCPKDNKHRLHLYHTIPPLMGFSTNYDSVFTALSALTPIPKADDSRRPLKSCLITYSSIERSTCCRRCSSCSFPRRQDPTLNEEFLDSPVHPMPNVFFPQIHMHKYEMTLGDNTSVSSGRPLSPDWRHDSHELVISLERITDGEEAAEEPLQRQVRMEEIKVEECKSRMLRCMMTRSGIVDGGLMISMTLASI